MPDITSYLTAAGAYQTRDLVLKLAPTSAFFFPIFFFSVKKKMGTASSPPRVVYVYFEGGLSVSVGSIRYTMK